jgi:hypothetical protein
MTADATTQLIARINNQFSQAANLPSEASRLDFLGTLNSLIAVAANYAQILGTAASINDAASVVAAAAKEAAASGATAASVSAEAATAGSSGGVGAIIIVFVSLMMGALSQALGGSGGFDEDAALAQLVALALDEQNGQMDTYWENVSQSIGPYWTALYTDLDNLAAQGVDGPDVKGPPPHAYDFFTAAQEYVNNLLNTTQGYWERPSYQNLVFQAEQVPCRTFGDLSAEGWYGNMPWPQPVDSAIPGSEAAVIHDPRTMLPSLVWGITSYLTIAEVMNTIDQVQYTFAQFIDNAQYRADMTGYARFIYQEFILAVGAQDPSQPDAEPSGLIKSDIPELGDVGSFVLLVTGQQSPFGESESYPGPSIGGAPSAGDGWNGVFGVVDQFGVYPAPVPVPASTPSYIIDLFPGFAIEYLGGDPTLNDPTGISDAGVSAIFAATAPGLLDLPLPIGAMELTYPWIQIKLILGLMARWKALYLFKGYDQIWAFTQRLLVMSKKSAYPVLYLPDGTLANENWSMRELIDAFTSNSSNAFPFEFQPNSLFSLIQGLDEVANGSWAGPAIDEYTFSKPARPVSFRDRLAAASV